MRTLVQKVSSGHFLARGRIHGFSAASRRFVDGNPSSDTVYEKPPVQKLVASLLFAKGEKAIQALIRYPQQAEKLEFGNLYCATTKLSLRTSDRCHWCGNPFSFLAILSLECVMGCGLPRQCAHWLAMTYWTTQARKNRACPKDGKTTTRAKSRIARGGTPANPNFPQQILNNFPTAGKHYHRKSNFWR